MKILIFTIFILSIFGQDTHSSNNTISVNDSISAIDTLNLVEVQEEKVLNLKSDNISKSYWQLLANDINSYSSLIVAIIALIALYLGDLHKRIFKPKLKPRYDMNFKPPFYQHISFDIYGIIPYKEFTFELFQPGINTALRIDNKGSITARNVSARIEKILIYHDSKQILDQSYHPTTIKWSGELSWNPVDISPKSYFYLDLFYVKNEYFKTIFDHNMKIINNTSLEIYDDTLKDIISNLNITEKIYWNVWIDSSYARGLPTEYYHHG